MTQFINDSVVKGGPEGSIDGDLVKVNADQITVDGEKQLNVVPPSEATTNAAGLLSAAGKSKLDGIETGAEVNRTREELGADLDTLLGGSAWRDPARVDGLTETIKTYPAQTVTSAGDVYGETPEFDRALTTEDRGKLLVFMFQIDGNTYGHFSMPVDVFLDTTDTVADGEGVASKDAWGMSFPITSAAWERIKIAKMSNSQVALASINNAVSINGGYVFLMGVGHADGIKGEEVLLNVADWPEPSNPERDTLYLLPEFSRALTSADSDRVMLVEMELGGRPKSLTQIYVGSFLSYTGDPTITDGQVLTPTYTIPQASWAVHGLSGSGIRPLDAMLVKMTDSRFALAFSSVPNVGEQLAQLTIRLLPQGIGGPDAEFAGGQLIKSIPLGSTSGWTEITADTDIKPGGLLEFEFVHSGNTPDEHSGQVFPSSNYFELPVYASTSAIVAAARNVIRAYGLVVDGTTQHRADIAIARKDASTFFWWTDGTDNGTTVRIRQHLINGGGTGVDDDEVRALVMPYARADSTAQVGGAQLENSGVASVADLSSDLSHLTIGGLYFVESEGSFHELQADSERAALPLRITFPPTDLGLDDYLVRGWCNIALTGYSSTVNGTIALAPDVTGTIPVRLRGIFAVDSLDETAGDLVIAIETTSTFTPDTFTWSVGGVRREITGLSRIHENREGYSFWLASHEVTSEYANLWSILKGQTADAVVDLDIRDADGNSFVEGATLTRKLVPVETGYIDRSRALQRWTKHDAPDAHSVMLVDDATGDEYYARTEPADDTIIVEPVNISGFRYGITTANKAATGVPSWLRELHYDRTNGEVVFSADDTEMSRARSLVYYDGDDPSHKTGPVTCPFVPLPASSDYTQRGQKHARLRRFGSLQPSTEAATVSGKVRVRNDGMDLFYDPTSRKIEAIGTWPDCARDRWQVVRLQRIKFGLTTDSGHTRLEFVVPHNTLDGGTEVLGNNVVGETADGLHPCFQSIVMRWSDGTNPQVEAGEASRRLNSWIDAPFDASERNGTLYLAFDGIDQSITTPYVDGRLDGGMILVPLTYQSDLSSGQSTRRHRYTIAADAHQLPWSSIGSPNLTHWWAAGLVFKEDGEQGAWTYSLQPQEFDRVEIDGVAVPLDLTKVDLVNEHAIEQGDGPNDAWLRYHWESDAYDAVQDAPLVAGSSYRINFLGDRGVRSSRFDAVDFHLTTDRAHRFGILDADGTSMLDDTVGHWWDVKSRSSKVGSGDTFPGSRAFRRFRRSGGMHVALPETMDRELLFFWRVSADGEDLNAYGFTRTEFNPIGNAGTNWVLHSMQLVDFMDTDTTLYIYAATGDRLPVAQFTLRNLSRGTSETHTISPSPTGDDHDRYSGSSLLREDYRDGDQCAITFVAPGHTTPVVHSHRANVWRQE